MENADAYHANGDTLNKRPRENDENPVEPAEAEVAGPKRVKQELSQESVDKDTVGVPMLGDHNNDQKSNTDQGQSGDNMQHQQQQQQQALQHQQLMQQLAFQQMAALAAASGFPQQPFYPMMLNPAVLQQMCLQMQAFQQLPANMRSPGASPNETTIPSATATQTPPEQVNVPAAEAQGPSLSQEGNGSVKDETAPAAQPSTTENQTNPYQPSPSVNQHQHQQQQQQQAGEAMMPPMFFPQMNQIQQAQNAYAQLLMNPTPFQQRFQPVYHAPNRRGINLALPCDNEQLSEYQIMVRQQLEVFEAGSEDVDSNTQGRKKSVVLGQVGLRCIHCATFPLRTRGRGAIYYPSKLQGIYQAAQNMAGSHLIASCQQIPPQLKIEIRELRERRDNASGGKQYWADACEALGLYETEDGLKLNTRSAADGNI